MSFTVNFCKALNRLFKPPEHPFNMGDGGGGASKNRNYALWQYERGAQTLEFYGKYATPEEMFAGKVCLDIGCGAAGKTLYYAGLGTKHVYGLEVLPSYKEDAEVLARELGLSEQFTFVCDDAADTRFPDGMFDTVIMNDAMEHVNKPEAVLDECRRILAPGGRLYVNFPPYWHPYGAHLSDVMGMPWVHLFFSERTLVRVYKDMVSPLPDRDERISFRISTRKNARTGKDEEYFHYINRMTAKRFKRIVSGCGMKVAALDEEPLRSFMRPVLTLPGLRELFIRRVVAVLER